MTASNSLTGNSPGQTYVQILHIGTGTPGVAVIRTGDGTATALSFVSGGAKVTGTLEVTTNLTVDGNATISGTLSAIGVPVITWTTSDVTASTTTQVTITGLSFTPVSGKTYMVELELIAQSVATTTGVQIVNSGGAGTLVMADTTGVGIAAISGTYAATSSPVSAANFVINLKGIFVASSTAPLTFDVKSEVASSAVTIKAYSHLKITPLN